MDVKQVLRMKEGTSENSYTKTSYIQKQVLNLTKSIKEKAIRDFYCKERPTTLCIADLGCSSAELNTLNVVSELIAAVETTNLELEHGPITEYQVYLNDLPSNDFNTLFRSLVAFEDSLKQLMGDGFRHCFVNGVPGSFYSRLFPIKSLHFIHSSYSLMWLSQVPEGLESNKGNIYMARTSPPSVFEAYYEQFQKDFLMFLHCRSQEMVAGGKMVLTILGRNFGEPYSKESCYMWELLASVLNNMVLEGLIEEEKLHTFNIPQYAPSAAELRFIIESEGSFTLDQVHVSEVTWEASDENVIFDHHDFTKSMRSVSEPLLISHFGEEIIEDVFQRFKEIARISMSKEKNVYINVTVSMTRNIDAITNM